MAILATLTLNYGMKIRSNEKKIAIFLPGLDALNILTQQNQSKGYRHFKGL